MIVLGGYDGSQVVDLESVSVLNGFFWTYKDAMIVLRQELQRLEILHLVFGVCTDGTYSLLRELGWIVLVLAFTVTRYDTSKLKFVNSAVPIIFGLVKSESEASFSALFTVAKNSGRGLAVVLDH